MGQVVPLSLFMTLSHFLTVHRRGAMGAAAISNILGPPGGTHERFSSVSTLPIASFPNRVLKNGASGRDPAVSGFCNCSHIF
jgi:hypothetical protein